MSYGWERMPKALSVEVGAGRVLVQLSKEERRIEHQLHTQVSRPCSCRRTNSHMCISPAAARDSSSGRAGQE
jgi:hypothetical protein